MTRTERLDAFTDAAFAFAISLMVIGGEGAPEDYEALVGALAELPAFAFGFAIMAMFWAGHVRWRRMRGDGDMLSVLLTLLLLFLTLVYVQPLRAMALAVAKFFTGYGPEFQGSITGLFSVYGTGFVMMSLTMAALWAEALRSKELEREVRFNLNGEMFIWLILAATGLVLILLSMTAVGEWAAMSYATLPITIGLFVWYWNWTGEQDPDGEA